MRIEIANTMGIRRAVKGMPIETQPYQIYALPNQPITKHTPTHAHAQTCIHIHTHAPTRTYIHTYIRTHNPYAHYVFNLGTMKQPSLLGTISGTTPLSQFLADPHFSLHPHPLLKLPIPYLLGNIHIYRVRNISTRPY